MEQLERFNEGLLRGHVAKHKGDLRLQKLQWSHLSQLYATLRKSKEVGGAGLAGRTVLHVHRVLSKSLKQAKQKQLIAASPAEGLEAPKAEAAQIEILSADQVKTVLTYLQGANAPDARDLSPLVHTALVTGMRRGWPRGSGGCPMTPMCSRLRIGMCAALTA